MDFIGESLGRIPRGPIIEPHVVFMLICGVVSVISAIITAAVSWWKRQNLLEWGILGGLFPVMSLLVLVSRSPRCPRCDGPLTDKEFRDKRCPRCTSPVEGVSEGASNTASV